LFIVLRVILPCSLLIGAWSCDQACLIKSWAHYYTLSLFKWLAGLGRYTNVAIIETLKTSA